MSVFFGTIYIFQCLEIYFNKRVIVFVGDKGRGAKGV